MTVKYITSTITDLKLRKGAEVGIIIPTDFNTKIFPEEIKSFSNNAYNIFKQFAAQSTPDTVLIGINLSSVNLLFPICINNDTNMLDYTKFFYAIDFIVGHNHLDVLYIPQIYIEEYLSSFEGFEFDIATDYKDNHTTIIIVNKNGTIPKTE